MMAVLRRSKPILESCQTCLHGKWNMTTANRHSIPIQLLLTSELSMVRLRSPNPVCHANSASASASISISTSISKFSTWPQPKYLPLHLRQSTAMYVCPRPYRSTSGNGSRPSLNSPRVAKLKGAAQLQKHYSTSPEQSKKRPR